MLTTTLDRYVLAELLRTLVLALLVIVLIFILGTTVRLMKDDLTYSQLVRSLPYAIAFTLPYALPMALLVAVALTVGRLVADRETLALEASGIPPRQIAVPVIALGAAVSVLSLFLQSTVLPYCHRIKGEIGAAVLEQMVELGHGIHWTKVFWKKGFDVYVREHRGPDLRGVIIHRDFALHPATIVAERGTAGYDRERGTLVLSLENVGITVFVRARNDSVLADAAKPPAQGDPIALRFDRYRVEVPIGTADMRVRATDYTTAQLVELLAQYQGPQQNAAVDLQDVLIAGRAELTQRAVLGLAPLLFVLLVVPLTLVLRATSRLVPLVLGTLVASVFFLGPLLLGVSLADRKNASPLWPLLAPAIALPAALGLGRLARRIPAA